MAGLDPKTPLRADHRFLKKLVDLTLKGKADPTPEQFNRVSRVFYKLGGSWERVFKGSVDDIEMLKKVLKVGLKSGYLKPKDHWS